MKYGVFVVIPVDRFDLTDDTIFSDDMAIVELEGKDVSSIVLEALAQLDIEDFIYYKSHNGDTVVECMRGLVDRGWDGMSCVEYEEDLLTIFYTVKDVQ